MTKAYTSVQNPRWANAENTFIDCDVNFSHLPDEFVPFTANPNDVMGYSKEIFDECVAGEYGEIGEYVAPPPPPAPPEPTKEDLMAQIQALTAQIQALP
jgi:hypothetical protein